MAAFRASRLVWSAISSITSIIAPILRESSSNRPIEAFTACMPVAEIRTMLSP
ncbi:hypothetical protein D3C76_1750650 [compost metagenome]